MSESRGQGPLVPPKGTALALLGAGQYGVFVCEAPHLSRTAVRKVPGTQSWQRRSAASYDAPGAQAVSYVAVK